MPVTSQNHAESSRVKFRELISRHQELDQHKIKAETLLLSVLFMTQITELKLLLDVGRLGHTFYYFVLALLVTALGMLVLVGVLLIYIGNLRFTANADRKVTWLQRLKHCLLCRCTVKCPCCKKQKRESSYVCVPLPEHRPATPDANNLEGDAFTVQSQVDDPPGCCFCPGLKPQEAPSSVEEHSAEMELAQVKVAEAVLKMAQATSRVEDLDNSLRKKIRDPDLEEALKVARAELTKAKRDKEEGESALHLAEAQHQATILAWDQWEQQQERLVFKKLMFWQQITIFLLYFILLMNIFITAFGIYGRAVVSNDSDAEPGTEAP